MIRIDVALPLAAFPLRVTAELGGGVTAIMGPSGGGKTSLLESIAGLRPRATGRVVVGDDVVLDTVTHTRVAPERRRLGYVPQGACLFPHLTVLENVRFGARGGLAEGPVVDVLEIGPLLARYPASLSGGERQRVALARALAASPRLLLLDEPLAALDLALRERIVPYLVRIREEWGIPMLYVTHNVGEAVRLADEVLILRDGRVESRGAPLELLSSTSFAGASIGDLENLLSARVVSHDAAGGVTALALASGLVVAAPLASGRAVGSRVTLSIRAEDVLVCSEEPRFLSARNVYPARLSAIDVAGTEVTLRCAVGEETRPWLVRVTPAAANGLQLRAGAGVWLAVKSHSVRFA